MWIPRDFDAALIAAGALPIKVLKGPRQVGKTSVLERLGTHQVVYLDDAAVRARAIENPRLLLDSLPPRLTHLRSKDRVKIDLLVHLSDDRTIAIEVKSTPTELDKRQLRLLDTLGITVVERWVATPTPARTARRPTVDRDCGGP